MSQFASEGSGGQSVADERYIVVSTDSHVGPSVKGQLRGYCESKYLDDFDRFVAEMEGHGLLSWRSSEASKPGEDESWSLAKSRAQLGEEQAKQFGKVAGIPNADQVDRRFLQRSYEASLLPGLQDHSARLDDMDRAGVAAAVIYHGGLNGQSSPSRPPVSSLGRLEVQPPRVGGRPHLQSLAR